jgi:hypothetical protein
MKKFLIKINKYKLYHVVSGQEIEGKKPNLNGDCSWMRGNCSWLLGDCSGLRGDCTGLIGDCTGLIGDCTMLRGDCTGLRGDCSWLSGNIDDCDISDDERENGIDITDLIESEK